MLLPSTSSANLPLALLEQDQILVKYKFTTEDVVGAYLRSNAAVSFPSTTEISRDKWLLYL